MGRIRILPPDQAHKIAAGEVIERPANIVKELVENSVDAGSTSITIRIEKAGSDLIEISDNGCGMDRADAQACFARHATSKLHSVEQLMDLHSFGFRGEALASVAAVSKVTLQTKQPENALGTVVTTADSRIVTVEDWAGTAGTTISVADLFYNVPVRKKFLRQEDSEWSQIQLVVWALSLTHLHISYKLYRDGKLVLNAPAVSTIHDRLTQVWGHDVTANLIPIEPHPTPSRHTINISGMLSRPTYWRYGKQHLFFFVNGRLVKNSDLSKALMKGYRDVLPHGRFPAACIFITLDAAEVDVNIHPRKEEVRFMHPNVLLTAITEQVTKTLEQLVRSTLQPMQSAPAPQPFTPQQPFSFHLPPQPLRSEESFVSPSAIPFAQPVIATEDPNIPSLSAEPTTQQRIEATTIPPHILGQLFATYIVIQRGDEELVIVDQHAAHERVLYHQFTHRFTRKEGTRLLFPELIALPQSAITALLAHQSFFESQGIELEQAGSSSLAVLSTPPGIQKESLRDFLRDCADFIHTHSHLATEEFSRQLNEHVHSHMACKAAVRAGDILDQQAMSELITKLLATPNCFICVHGRPTMWTMRKTELERIFRRC